VDIEPITSVDDLIGTLAQGVAAFDSPDGRTRECVDLLSHALQCAHEVSRRHPDDIELQAAALVHDLGHQLAPGDDAGHGLAGAAAVRELLGDRVARLVEYHVPAKRYLVTVDPDYRATLSPVSIRTLEHQGGTMTPDEVAEHARLDDWSAALDLRRADEAAKVPGRDVPGLAHWHRVLTGLVAR
jgi:predicted HD phosphohydrolase